MPFRAEGSSHGEVNNFILPFISTAAALLTGRARRKKANERKKSRLEKNVLKQMNDGKKRERNVANVGDGKLKTNNENALAFIRYSVDVC